MVEPSPSPAPSSLSEQQYSLRWNDYHTSILSSFRHLRDEEDFIDVTLACDGSRSFTAHKVVLSACSPYFKRLLKANPCKHPIIILRDVRGDDMESLLRFMYHGEVHIGHEQLSDFLKTAQLLQVRGLVDVPAPGIHAPPNTTNELKASPTSTSLPWELLSGGGGNSLADERERPPRSTSPPPSKRARSSDLYRAQMRAAAGLSPDRIQTTTRGRERTRDRERDRDREHRDNGHGLDMRESLLGQALEGGPTLHVANQKPHSDSSLQAQSTGEDSNSSDTAPSEHGGKMDDRELPESEYGDHPLLGANGGLMGDHSNRSGTFPGALLGLQGLPGMLPGPSGMLGQQDSFGELSRRSLDMLRVRATDPRPCPKCGKIYRSAHTLRTHLEDKHTVCPGYRCVLCGTVAKSRNSLHSHMSRQHRGISTKDLPVLPMPSPFDPELASRLLAKAGVKISAAELRARASPNGPRRSDVKLEVRGSGQDSEAGGSVYGDNDPEDLTMSHHGNHSVRYGGEGMVTPPGYNNHPNTTITKVNVPRAPHSGLTPKSIDSLSKDHYGVHVAPAGATGSAILDTYLQFITENTFGMNMTQEQAAAAVHAAKMAQLSAMGLDKLGHHGPPFDLKAHLDHKALLEAKGSPIDEIRRDTDEPMDLGMDVSGPTNQEPLDSSDDEANYSDEDDRRDENN